MYYVWKNGALLKVYRTFRDAVSHAREVGGYVEHGSHVVWGMQ